MPMYSVPGLISIHAPRVGSDTSVAAALNIEALISIHAPRVGSDIGHSINSSNNINFNPRSP